MILSRETLLDTIIPSMRSWSTKERRNPHESECPRTINECLAKVEDLSEDMLVFSEDKHVENKEGDLSKSKIVARVKMKGTDWKPVFDSKHVGSSLEDPDATMPDGSF